MRDADHLPMCPPPFGCNHALWTFAETNTQRGYFADHMFARQLHLFRGSERAAQRVHAESLSRAMFGLVQLQTIDTYMNCTTVDNDENSLLETVTLPFYFDDN
jgi:hypothetical protein